MRLYHILKTAEKLHETELIIFKFYRQKAWETIFGFGQNEVILFQKYVYFMIV